MGSSLDEALKRLDTALGLLEASVTRRLDAERRRGDLETELQIMQDDRARLAVELEGADERLKKLEAVTHDVRERVARASTTVQLLLAEDESWIKSVVEALEEPWEGAEFQMPQVMVTIAGRSYRMACGEGEEAHLEGLAALYDSRIDEMRNAFGEIGDMRLHVMAALTVADEVLELRKTLEKTKAELAECQALASSGDERSAILEGRFAEKLEKTADRIERITKALNAAAHQSLAPKQEEEAPPQEG